MALRNDSPRLISVLNHKGGVGKTVLSTELPILLAKAGARVLVVDLDPQTNLTLNMGFNQSAETTPEKTIAQAVWEPHKTPLDDVILPVDGVDGLFIAPGATALEDVADRLQVSDLADTRLDDLLQDLIEDKGERFDFVFIDCPPGLGVLSTNALIASTEVMVPVDLRNTNALVGVGRLAKKIEGLRRRGPADGLFLVGNMYSEPSEGTRNDEQRNLEAMPTLGYPTANGVVRYRKAIFKAHNRHEPLGRQTAGLSKGGKKALADFDALATELAAGTPSIQTPAVAA